jgi:hypothetical protein
VIGGVGIGFRRPHFDALAVELERAPRLVDFVEVVAETFVLGGPRERRALDAVQRNVPVLAHGVSTSLGGPSPLDAAWLAELKRWLDARQIPVFTEHLSWSSSGGAHSLELLTLPFNDASAAWLGRRAQRVAERLERPLWLENTAFYAVQPTSDRDVGEWTTMALRAAGAGLLLDLANLWVNAENHGRDAHADLSCLPLDRVKQVHLAGSRFEPAWQVRVDDHASAIPEPVLALYRHLLERVGPVPTLIEWDQNVPSLEVLLHEVERVRAVHDALARPDARVEARVP